MIKYLGIKGTLPLATLAIVLVILSISAVYITHTAKSVIMDVRARRIQDVSYSLSNIVSVQIQYTGKDILIAASSPQILQGLNLSSPPERNKRAQPLLSGNEKTAEISRSSLNTLLHSMMLTAGYYKSFCLLDNKGNLLAGSLDKGVEKAEVKNSDWFKKALIQSTFTIGTPFLPKGSESGYLLPVALKVLYNGNVGAVATMIQLGKITRGVLFETSRDGINTLILSKNGEVISSLNGADNYFEFDKEKWLPLLKSKTSGILDIKIKGEEKTVAFNHIPQGDMYAIAIAGDNYMLSSVRTIRNIAIFSDLACAFLAMVFLYLYLFPLVRDIGRLHSFVDSVTKGEQASVSDISREDEIGVLAKKMDNMVETLTEMVDKAEASSKAKSEFLARMTPEFRTPMSGILDSAYLALKEEPNSPQVDHLKKIDNSAKYLLGIINDILDFSMLEANEIDLSMQSFHLTGVLMTVSDILTNKVHEKGISFDFSIDSDVPDVLWSDALRLTQICINICSNAVKYTESGSIFLHVSRIDIGKDNNSTLKEGLPQLPQNTLGKPYFLAKEDSEKTTPPLAEDSFYIAFTITDTGIGIPEEKQKNLFKTLEHDDFLDVRHHGSEGIGLLICKSLVHAMHGRIGVASVLGKGSVFSFILPMSAGDLKEPGTFVEKLDENVLIPDIRILLAEDNEINQVIVLEMLVAMGISPTVVNNGQEVIDIWKEEEFDLILMDTDMPIVNGFDAARAIRASNKKNAETIPIIAMVANRLDSETQPCLEAGMNAHISKPLDATELRKTLAYWGSIALEETV